jgi:RNA polymerase sigma-70 factor (ECF subfamily)
VLEEQRDKRFGGMLASHLDAAYNLAFWLTRNPDTAEDCVQEACLRALRHFDSSQGDGRAWLLKIVRNTCYGWRQRLGNESMAGFDGEGAESAEAADTPSFPTEDPDTIMRHASLSAVEKALFALPPEPREIIVLRELENLPYLQIAEIVGIPVGTVMSRLSRARALLRQRLDRDGDA